MTAYASLEQLLEDEAKSKKKHHDRELMSDIISGITYMLPFTQTKDSDARVFGSVVNLANS